MENLIRVRQLTPSQMEKAEAAASFDKGCPLVFGRTYVEGTYDHIADFKEDCEYEKARDREEMPAFIAGNINKDLSESMLAEAVRFGLAANQRSWNRLIAKTGWEMDVARRSWLKALDLHERTIAVKKLDDARRELEMARGVSYASKS